MVDDIALLVVREGFDPNQESITFAPELATLLPESKSKEQSTKAGEICRIAGWGDTKPVRSFPGKLQEATVVIKGVKNCAKAYNQGRLQNITIANLLRQLYVDEKKNLCAIGRKGKPGKKAFVSDACAVRILITLITENYNIFF